MSRADANGGHGRVRRPPLRLFVGKSEWLSENFRILYKSRPDDWLMIIFLAFNILLLAILLLIGNIMLHWPKKAKVSSILRSLLQETLGFFQSTTESFTEGSMKQMAKIVN